MQHFLTKKRNVYTGKGKSHVGAIPLHNTEEASLLLHFHQIYGVEDEPGDSLYGEALRQRIFFGGSYTDALPFESEAPDLDDLVALAILLDEE